MARRIAARYSVFTLFGVALAVLAVGAAAQDADPVIGTWVLNIAKSKFISSSTPQSESRTYVLEGQETKIVSRGTNEQRTYRTVRQDIKASSHQVDGDGKLTIREWTVAYDGKDRPVTGDPLADMISAKRIDARTVEFALKKDGRVVVSGTQEISRDGTVMTIMSRGLTTNDVLVFDKQ